MPLAAKTMHAASFLLMLLAIGPPASNGQALDSQVNFAVAVEGQVDSSMAVSAVASPAVSIQLDMPSRLMWEEYDGYCGETSLQMSALYFGAYLSQRALRAAGGGPQNGGQLLLPYDPADPDVNGAGRNLLIAANKLKFATARFPTSSSGTQWASLLAWARSQLVTSKVPVIFSGYVADCAPACDSDYDHIMVATGYSSASSTTSYKANDVLTFSTLFTTYPVRRTFGSLPGGSLSPKSSRSCRYESLAGGCLPTGTNFGVAITGVLDAQRTSLPVRLAVNRQDEPNTPLGQKPVALRGTVTVSGLKPGAKYRLLRFDNPASVPTRGNAAVFLASKYVGFKDFTASAAAWVYTDPASIMSDSTTYYRCVAMPS